MIHSSTQIAEKNLKLLMPSTNKALALALKSASPAQLQTLTQVKDLSTLLSSILKQNSTTNEEQNNILLSLLKNNPTLKSLANATPDIKALLQLLKQNKQAPQLQKTLQNMLTDVKDINPKELHSKLKMTGILLENQLKKNGNPKELLSNDLKALLSKTHDELSNRLNSAKSQEILKHIDKLNLIIDYSQLVSHLSNAASFYLPYSWDVLKEGEINIKQMKNKTSLCDIHLELQEYGAIDLRLALFEKNQLTMNITTESQTLKTLILDNMHILKKQLSNAAIIPKEIRFVEGKKTMYDAMVYDNLAMGFEVKA
ncbi:flagellar hook-length control protein FliK [Sulfurimonas sp.]|uniref:flagellar hook-length control protein FliK n=1 Tax=Sulfurimonas sp. TaxID=2022749 RepID=UPI00261AF2C5|nr:flagellar hook-length control protein FliK [Sulfurimonas sp.]